MPRAYNNKTPAHIFIYKDIKMKSNTLRNKRIWLPIFSLVIISGCNDDSDPYSIDIETDNQAPVFTVDLPETTGPAARLVASDEISDPLSPNSDEAIIYFVDNSGKDYSQYSLYTWNDANCDASDASWIKDWNDQSNTPTAQDEFGAYWRLPLSPTSEKNCVNVILRDQSVNNLLGSDGRVDLSDNQASASFIQGNGSPYATRAEAYQQLVGIANAKAHLLSGYKLAWMDAPSGADEYRLYVSWEDGASFDQNNQYIQPYAVLKPSELTAEEAARQPQVAQNSLAFAIDSSINMKNAVKAQLYAIAVDDEGYILSGTQVQTANSLDDLFASSAQSATFGATILDDAGTRFNLWAPSALNVELVLFDQDKNEKDKIQMDYQEDSGIWSLTTDKAQSGDYYLYDINVFHPSSKKFETYQVTDPYSLSLATDSRYSQVVDLDSEALKPEGWDDLERPIAQDNPADFIIYESHVRDFSSLDPTIEAPYQGKYLAFTQSQSTPVKHLKELSESGVTHLHLLPIFDIATINESAQNQVNITEAFSRLCEVNPDVAKSEFATYCDSGQSIQEVLAQLAETDSPENNQVQALQAYISQTDGFNWGYDPFHYTVPEGSYSTEPEGSQRILETRQMVQAIKQDIGMNVVMDVVYNHTNSAGPTSDTSVLDKIVPWYYNRLNPITGIVENSTCCSNTAPEHQMMAKLIKDSLVVWARDYKIDAFRFDLMAHHPLAQIQESLAEVQKVDPSVYFYGEGWNFGEVADDALFTQASQANLAGTGIGSFSDRLRDAVRGGSPFDTQESIRKNQGFGNGAYVDPNEIADVSKDSALHLADLVRLGMAGNLKDFQFIDSTDNLIKGEQLDYNGQAAGYAQDPSEIQNYVSKHDNQTLWDNNQYKIDYSTPIETRVRIQAVSLATAMLGQGVPFTHMGSELLRSKSMQRDSYDSGDWYNKVDFGLEDNNWDKGLPRFDKDGENYALIQEVIDNNAEMAVPEQSQMQTMVSYYQDLAKLRKTYPLLRLGKGEEVIQRLAFHNTGSQQVPGVIIMSIDNGSQVSDLDPNLDGLIVAINATPDAINFTLPSDGFSVSPVYQSDLATGVMIDGNQLELPAWTPAVLILERDGERGEGIPASN